MSDQDPLGKGQHTVGAKLDKGKNRLGLVLGDFSSALYQVGLIGTYGAEKYTDGGWKEVPNGKQRYEDAMLRHWLAYKGGETFDTESGLPHLAHMAWNALAVLTLSRKDPLSPQHKEMLRELFTEEPKG